MYFVTKKKSFQIVVFGDLTVVPGKVSSKEVIYAKGSWIFSKLNLKEWNELGTELRWKFLGKLNPKVFTQLVKAISGIDSPEEEIKN